MTNEATQRIRRPSREPADRTVQDVLRGALDLLIRDGWCQGAWRDDDRRCLMSAISDASGRADGEPLSAVGEAAMRFLQEEGSDHIVSFNDDPTTTFDSVVSLLERTLGRANKIADVMQHGGIDRRRVSSGYEAVIETAIQLLETDGWCQGRNTDGTKRCLHLALAHGAQEIGQYPLGYCQAFSAVENLIGDIPSQPPGNKLSAYNDLPTTTYEDIILLLKEAAKP